MNIRTRKLLLAIASLLDSWVQGIRRYCRARTPKRVKRLHTVDSATAVDRHHSEAA